MEREMKYGLKFAQADNDGFVFYRGEFEPSDPRCKDGDIITVSTLNGLPAYTLGNGKCLCEEPAEPDREEIARMDGRIIAAKLSSVYRNALWTFVVRFAARGFELFDAI